MTNKKSIEKSNERKELVLPRDVSFALKSLINGREGMCIPSGVIEKLCKDEKEFAIFAIGVERHLKQLGVD